MLIRDNAHSIDEATGYENKDFNILYARSYDEVDKVPVTRVKNSGIGTNDVMMLFGGFAPILFYKFVEDEHLIADFPNVLNAHDPNSDYKWVLQNIPHQIQNEALEHAPVQVNPGCFEVWQSSGSAFREVVIRDRLRYEYGIFSLWDGCDIFDNSQVEDTVHIPRCIGNVSPYTIAVAMPPEGDRLITFSHSHNKAYTYNIEDISFNIIEAVPNEESVDLGTDHLMGAFFEFDGQVLFLLDHVADDGGGRFQSHAVAHILSIPYDSNSIDETITYDLSLYNYEPSKLIDDIDSGMFFNDYKMSHDGELLHFVGQNKEIQSQAVWFFDSLQDAYLINTADHKFYIRCTVMFQDYFPDEPEEDEFVGSAEEACVKFIDSIVGYISDKLDNVLNTPETDDLTYKIFGPTVGAPLEMLGGTVNWSVGDELPEGLPLKRIRFDYYNFNWSKYADKFICSLYFAFEYNAPFTFDVYSILRRNLLPHRESEPSDSWPEDSVYKLEYPEPLLNSVVDFNLYSNFKFVDSEHFTDYESNLDLSDEPSHSPYRPHPATINFHDYIQCNVPYSSLLSRDDEIPVKNFYRGLEIPRFTIWIDIENAEYKAYGLNHLIDYEWEHPFWLQYISELIRIYTGRQISIIIILIVYKQYIKSIDKGGAGRLPDFTGICRWCTRIASGHFSSLEEFMYAFAMQGEVIEGMKLMVGAVYTQGILNYELYSFEYGGTDWDTNEEVGTAENFPRFFDTNENGVEFVQSGTYEDAVYFVDGNEPSYLTGEHIAWKLEGFLYVPSSDYYTFTFGCDDMGDVLIDGSVILSKYQNDDDDYEGLDDVDDMNTIYLEKGYHSIIIRLVQGERNIGIGLAWKRASDSGDPQIIPQSSFYTMEYEFIDNLLHLKYKKLVGDITYHNKPFFYHANDIIFSEEFEPPLWTHSFETFSEFEDYINDNEIVNTVYYNNAFIADYETGCVKQYWLSKELVDNYPMHSLDEIIDCAGAHFPRFSPDHIATYDFGFEHITDLKIVEDILLVTGNDPNKTCRFYLSEMQKFLKWRWVRVGDLTRLVDYWTDKYMLVPFFIYYEEEVIVIKPVIVTPDIDIFYLYPCGIEHPVQEAVLSQSADYMYISDDDHHLYVSYDGTIYHYYMSTAKDINSATLQSDIMSTYNGDYGGSFQGFYMNPTRDKLIGVGTWSTTSGAILVVFLEYTLSSGDLDTVSYEGRAVFQEIVEGYKYDLKLNDDGSLIFNSVDASAIIKNELFTNWTVMDIGEYSFGYPEDLNQSAAYPTGCKTFDFCQGSILFTGDGSQIIRRYELLAPYDLSSLTETDEIDIGIPVDSIVASSDGTKLYIGNESGIYQFFLGDIGGSLILSSTVFTTDSNGLIEEKPEDHEASRWAISNSDGTVILHDITSTTQLTEYQVPDGIVSSGNTYMFGVLYKGEHLGWHDEWATTTYTVP